MFTVHQTNQGRFALVNARGETEHVFDSELAAQHVADFKNRSNYEPPVSPYEIDLGPCEVPVKRGRWDRKGRAA